MWAKQEQDAKFLLDPHIVSCDIAVAVKNKNNSRTEDKVLITLSNIFLCWCKSSEKMRDT